MTLKSSSKQPPVVYTQLRLHSASRLPSFLHSSTLTFIWIYCLDTHGGIFLLIWEVYSIISCVWARHLNSFYTHNVFQTAFKIGQMTHTTKICASLQKLSKVNLKNQFRYKFHNVRKIPVLYFEILQFIMTSISDSPESVCNNNKLSGHKVSLPSDGLCMCWTEEIPDESTGNLLL